MPRLIGPALSLEARKQMGKGLIFKSYRKRAVVVKYNKPGSVKKFQRSSSQAQIRNFYYGVIDDWRKLTGEEKQSYRDLAKKMKNVMSGWNLYYKQRFEEWWNQPTEQTAIYGERIYGDYQYGAT